MEKFVQGLKLSELYYWKCVRPIIESHYEKLKYSCGLIGPGSEVLGFDTPMSRDHHWGPRLVLFLREKDYSTYRNKLSKILSHELPYQFMGYWTSFTKGNERGAERIQEKIASGPVSHFVDIVTPKYFFAEHLGFDPERKISILNWLTVPSQNLRILTEGKIFHDGLKVKNIQRRLKSYPKDIWLYLLSAQWSCLNQEVPFVGRCGEVGDELGAHVVTARVIKNLMRLCFLMERQYAPYSKWYGTGFSRLKCSKKLNPIFISALSEKNWKARQKILAKSYKLIGEMHNSLKITWAVHVKISQFHKRPFLTINASDFSCRIRNSIRNRKIKNLKAQIGSIDTYVDSVDVLVKKGLYKKLQQLYF